MTLSIAPGSQRAPPSSIADTIMAVDIASKGAELQTGVPKALFEARIPNVFIPGEPINAPATAPYPYVVTADGKRFLVAVDQAQFPAAAAPITLVVNWPALLQK